MAFIYHYSKERYAILKCKALQEAEKEKDAEKPAWEILRLNNLPYDRSISFLMEPAPLDIIGGIFGRNHHTWAPGTQLFEYKVDTGSLGPLFFKLVESVEATDFYYDPKYEKLVGDAFVRARDALVKKLGYIGTDIQQLDKLTKANKGNTRKYYELIASRPNFADIKDKYAATVPHLMLYPRYGMIRPMSVQRVTVARSSSKDRPKYTNW